MEEEFDFGNNYKLKQNYYKEKYKNRGGIKFAQPAIPRLFANNQVAKLTPKKGKTYRKEEK